MNKRRDHFIEFIYYNVQNIRNQILPFLGLVISLLGEENRFTPFIKVGFYLLIAFILSYSFLKWYSKLFEFNDQMIRISEGVFSKRKNDIPYHRVKSINTSDSLLKRVFKIANFSVELIGGNKVEFVLKQKEIKELKSRLFSDTEENKEELKGEKLKPLEYMMLSLTNLTVFLAAFSLTSTLFTFFTKLTEDDQEDIPDKGILETFKGIDFFSLDFLLPMIILFIGMVIFSYLVSFLYIYLTFGNFKTTSNTNDIHIEYGILNKKKYHIPKNQIRSLLIKEPFIFKAFGYAQLKVDNIGLNEGNSSSVIFHPILKKEQIQELLTMHLTEFKEQELIHKPERTALPLFLFQSIIKITLSAIILFFFSPKFLYLFLLIPFFLIKGYAEWKYSGLSFNEKYTTIRESNRFCIHTTIILKKYVETTNTTQSVLMKKKNLYHYDLAVYSENLTETFKVKFLSSPNPTSFHQYLKL